MTNVVFPGYYQLINASIKTFRGEKPINISSIIHTFVIEESLDMDSIRGHLDVMDNVGLLDSLPIRGEETLTLEIIDALKTQRKYDLHTYKVSDVTIKKTNDGLMYRIHFTSYARFVAGSRRIIRPFENVISEIAKTIFADYYVGEKQLQVEDTEGIFRCIIPNYTPMQAMNFLANRAFSTNSPSCSFRFFETAENFYFVSDEFLINRALVDPNLIKEFTYSDAIDKSGKEFTSQMKNISEIRNSDRVNSVSDIYSGAYKSNVIEIDLVKKVVENKRYDYNNEKGEFVNILKNPETQDIHSEEFYNAFFTEENEKRYLLIKDYTSTGDTPGQLRAEQHVADITNKRVAYRHHLNNTLVYASLPGRFDIQAGDIINIIIPEFTSSSNKTKNKILSGIYLVNDVKHIFEMDVHQTHIKILKYDWG